MLYCSKAAFFIIYRVRKELKETPGPWVSTIPILFLNPRTFGWLQNNYKILLVRAGLPGPMGYRGDSGGNGPSGKPGLPVSY